MEEIKSGQFEKYSVTYTSDILQIGCENHPINKWWDFTNTQISAMDIGTPEWWTKWKPIIRQLIEMSPANDGKDNA